MVLCSQKVAYYFPENETIAFRWKLSSMSTGNFQTYGALQSEGGLLFPRERDHCIQVVANYFSEYMNFSNIWYFAIRRWLIISQRTRPLQSEGGLLFPRERDHCNQKVAYYFPENETIAFRWSLIISKMTGTFQT